MCKHDVYVNYSYLPLGFVEKLAPMFIFLQSGL